jgi:transcriptional regulator with XRE-family HTH domain
MMHYILSKITAKRLEKRYSQQYMADSLSITQGYYNKLENGKNEMSIQTLCRIMEILEMDISEIFGNKCPDPKKPSRHK